jgi:hypothetical protein
LSDLSVCISVEEMVLAEQATRFLHGPYVLTGPNSNSFARWIGVDMAGFPVTVPPPKTVPFGWYSAVIY